jgi:hypothetical protein
VKLQCDAKTPGVVFANVKHAAASNSNSPEECCNLCNFGYKVKDCKAWDYDPQAKAERCRLYGKAPTATSACTSSEPRTGTPADQEIERSHRAAGANCTAGTATPSPAPPPSATCTTGAPKANLQYEGAPDKKAEAKTADDCCAQCQNARWCAGWDWAVPKVKYACDNTTKTCAISDTGTFDEEKACDKKCAPPPPAPPAPTMYKCEPKSQKCALSPHGTFDNQTSCATACVPTMYACEKKSLKCTLSPYGTFGNQTSCAAACVPPTPPAP